VAYPERFLIPMREDLTRFGVEETRTPEDVDRVLASKGTVMMVVNSVCDAPRGKPGRVSVSALQSDVRPGKSATVFAGGRCRYRASAGYPEGLPAFLSLCSFVSGR